MRQVTVRQMRELLPEIDADLRANGEIVLTRRGKPIARMMPMPLEKSEVLSTQALRMRMVPLEIPSEVLLRQERDER